MENYKCYQCNGIGSHYWIFGDGRYFIHNNGEKVQISCQVCEGSGKVDWLENVFKTRKHQRSSSIRLVGDK